MTCHKTWLPTVLAWNCSCVMMKMHRKWCHVAPMMTMKWLVKQARMDLLYRRNGGKWLIHRMTYLGHVHEDGHVEFKFSNTEDRSHVTYHKINFPGCCKVECYCCEDCFECSTSWKKGFLYKFLVILPGVHFASTLGYTGNKFRT